MTPEQQAICKIYDLLFSVQMNIQDQEGYDHMKRGMDELGSIVGKWLHGENK